MHIEIQGAATFLVGLIRKKATLDDEFADKLDRFWSAFNTVLAQKYTGHWDPAAPLRGNGFRAIRSVPGRMDPVLQALQVAVGLPLTQLLPSELTVWIDPADVSVRIGEAGSVWRVDLTPPASPRAASPAHDAARAQGPSTLPPRSPPLLASAPALIPPMPTGKSAPFVGAPPPLSTSCARTLLSATAATYVHNSAAGRGGAFLVTA